MHANQLVRSPLRDRQEAVCLPPGGRACLGDASAMPCGYCCHHPCRAPAHCDRISDKAPERLKVVLPPLIILLIVGLVIFVSVLVFCYYWRPVHDGGLLPVDGAVEISGPAIFDPGEVAPEGGPCRRWVRDKCAEAVNVQNAIEWSRYYLRRGDAESALKNWTRARELYRASIDIGASVGAQPAIKAAKRLQFQSMTCEYTDESLARIARDYQKNPLGALIEMKYKQRALKALGHYNGAVDNMHGSDTRDAIRKFQDDLWFDEKGVLTAEQTVILICGAAEIAKDVGSQNILGVMYAGGLGVRQNTDFAMDWLEEAGSRGDADASWNLALLFGTGTVLSSIQVCDAVQNAERADSYLEEAAARGHPLARQTRAKYPSVSPEERWNRISGDLNKPEAINRVGRACNPNN